MRNFSVPLEFMLDGAKALPMWVAAGQFLLGCGWWARICGGAIPERMILEGDRLRIVWPDGRSELLRLDDAVHDGRGLLAGARWVPF